MEARHLGERGDITVLLVDGSLSRHDIEPFEREVAEALGDGPWRLVLDCSRVASISSAGVGALVALHQRLERDGGALRLASVPARVLDVLRILRLDSFFAIDPDVDRAVSVLDR